MVTDLPNGSVPIWTGLAKNSSYATLPGVAPSAWCSPGSRLAGDQVAVHQAVASAGRAVTRPSWWPSLAPRWWEVDVPGGELDGSVCSRVAASECELTLSPDWRRRTSRSLAASLSMVMCPGVATPGEPHMSDTVR
jgi:hypothetical protein